ncbi:hypothetical protein AY599_23605 [Leptolyngbya valderiana BDU 20041]|nr:hypothetical protein AY599_23605 [Leptolyngbya valderiana BDU 20041]
MADRDMAMRIASMGGEIANLKRHNAALGKLVEDYRVILLRAKSGRDLHCGLYVAKDYRFTAEEIERRLADIRDVAAEGSDG